MLWKGRAAFSRESRPRSIAKRAVTMHSRERWTSYCLCCELGSIKLRPVALRPRHKEAPPRFLSLTILRNARGQGGLSVDPDVLHKGFGLAAVRSPTSSRGDTGLAGRGPERGTTGTFNRQQNPMYGRIPPIVKAGLGGPFIGHACRRGRARGRHGRAVHCTLVPAIYAFKVYPPALGLETMAKPQAKQLVVCVSNGGYPASLEKRKIYVALRDADAEKLGLRRIVDESGDDYLYPKALFRSIELPQSVKNGA